MRYFKKFGDVVYEFTGMFPGRGDLLRDGWLEYSGVLPAERVGIEGGAIVELPEPEVVPPTRIFSKIEIRRSLRQLGESWEVLLDSLLDSDSKYRKDWTDSNEIREDDPMFVSFIQQISQLPEASGVDLNDILTHSITRTE